MVARTHLPGAGLGLAKHIVSVPAVPMPPCKCVGVGVRFEGRACYGSASRASFSSETAASRDFSDADSHSGAAKARTRSTEIPSGEKPALMTSLPG